VPTNYFSIYVFKNCTGIRCSHPSQNARRVGHPRLFRPGHRRPNQSGSACSIAAHPCKKRKDGAPSVGMAHGRSWKVGHPPPTVASALRSSALPCACSSTFLFPFLSLKSYSALFRKRASDHVLMTPCFIHDSEY